MTDEMRECRTDGAGQCVEAGACIHSQPSLSKLVTAYGSAVTDYADCDCTIAECGHAVEKCNTETALLSAIAALTEDAARLDWLDAQREPITNHDGTELLAYGWGIQEQRHTLRDAIDAARLDEATP
jgi:hypothetical protein